MRKRKHLRVLLIILLFIGAVISFAWYVEKTILPVKVKALVIDLLQRQTNRQVTLGEIGYKFPEGIVLKELVIFENPPLPPHSYPLPIWEKGQQETSSLLSGEMEQQETSSLPVGERKQKETSPLLYEERERQETYPLPSEERENLPVRQAGEMGRPEAPREFLRIKEISFNCLFLPLIKRKGVIIPALHIKSATIHLIRNQDGSYNFEDLPIFKKERPPQDKQRLSIFIHRASLLDGKIFFRDQKLEPDFTREIHDLAIQATPSIPTAPLHRPHTIKFNSSCKLVQATAANQPLAAEGAPDATVITKGKYSIADKDLFASIILKDVALPDYQPYYKQMLSPFELLQGLAHADLEISVGQGKGLFLSGNSSIKGIHLKKDQFNSIGDIFIEGQFSHILSPTPSPALTKASESSYQGLLTIKDHRIENVPFLKSLEHLNGVINFSKDNITTTRLKGFSFGCPVEFSGHLRDFQDPYIELSQIIEMDLAKLQNFLPPGFKKPLGQIKLEGKGLVNINLNGNLKQLPLNLEGRVKLQDANLRISSLLSGLPEVHPPAQPQQLNGISGTISFDRDSIATSDLTCLYRNTSYNLVGRLTGLPSPYVEARLKSEDLLAEAEFQIRERQVHLERLEGKFLNSAFSLLGEIEQLPEPLLNIYGEIQLDLADTERLFPKFQKKISKLRPAGICNLNLYLNGRPLDWKGWELGIKGDSDQVSLGGFNLGPLLMELGMKDKKIAVSKFRLHPYAGDLNLGMSMELEPENFPFRIEAQIADLDLSRLIEDTKLKDKEIWGIFSAAAALNGNAEDLKSIKGQGRAQIVNGRLWEIPLLGGLSTVLGIPALNKVTIKEAKGTFTVADGLIFTEDLQFYSEEVKLAMKGKMDFQGGLDFVIVTMFSPAFVERAGQFGMIASLILDESGGFMGRIRLSGTLKEPKYKFVPLPVKKILMDKFLGGIRDLLK